MAPDALTSRRILEVAVLWTALRTTENRRVLWIVDNLSEPVLTATTDALLERRTYASPTTRVTGFTASIRLPELSRTTPRQTISSSRRYSHLDQFIERGTRTAVIRKVAGVALSWASLTSGSSRIKVLSRLTGCRAQTLLRESA